MKTDGGWISISEAARLYGRSRKWVSNQVSTYSIETKKQGNQTQLRLVDLIQHRGEPRGGGTSRTGSPAKKSQKVAPIVAPESQEEMALMKQENQFLRRRIEELEADRAERQAREERLERIIEHQAVALPKPQETGLWARVVQWTKGG